MKTKTIISKPLCKFVLVALCIFLYGFSYKDSATIPALQEKDECMELQAGAIITYQFETSISVKFDIHSHINKTDVITLDKAFGTTQRGPKKVKINKDGVYCLNWKNRYRKDLQLNYQIHIKSP